MKTVAITYISVLVLLGIFAGPFMFGKERKPFDAASWIITSMLNLGVIASAWYLWSLS